MQWINGGGTSIGILSSPGIPKSALGMPIIHVVIMADILRWILVPNERVCNVDEHAFTLAREKRAIRVVTGMACSF
jgi:hypothetical protein